MLDHLRNPSVTSIKNVHSDRPGALGGNGGDRGCGWMGGGDGDEGGGKNGRGDRAWHCGELRRSVVSLEKFFSLRYTFFRSPVSSCT